MPRKPLRTEIDLLWRSQPVRITRTDTGWASTDPDLLVLLNILATKSWWGARVATCTSEVIFELAQQVGEVVAVRDPATLSLPRATIFD